MKKKAILPIALAFALAALTVALDCCTAPAAEPAPTDTRPAWTDVFLTDEPEYIPVSEVDEDVKEAVKEVFALEGGDLSKLGKYWRGTIAVRITDAGKMMEEEIYGMRAYAFAAPPVMTPERWDEMWAKADGEFGDDPDYTFVKSKCEGFYSLLDPADFVKRVWEERAEMFEGRFRMSLPETGALWVCDWNLSDSRLHELSIYFEKYFGYTVGDVRAAAVEAGVPDAELIGTVEPYFVFDYTDDGGTAIPVEYSEEALNRYGSLVKEYAEVMGDSFVYPAFEYEIEGAKFVSEGENFDSIRFDYKEQTGKDLLEICRVDIFLKRVGESVVRTGEYREYAPDDQIGIDDYVILLRTADGWETATIILPSGRLAYRIPIFFEPAFND